MAVLDKEQFFARLNERVGSDSSDEATTFLEDMADTYNDLSSKANGDGVDWKAKYNELDETWKKRYRHRFFNSDGGSPYAPDDGDDDKDDYDPAAITIDSLFK